MQVSVPSSAVVGIVNRFVPGCSSVLEARTLTSELRDQCRCDSCVRSLFILVLQVPFDVVSEFSHWATVMSWGARSIQCGTRSVRPVEAPWSLRPVEPVDGDGIGAVVAVGSVNEQVVILAAVGGLDHFYI